MQAVITQHPARVKNFRDRRSHDRSDNADRLRPGDLAWGNFIAIEHRFDTDQYFTTLYGHLGNDRKVKAGDIVQAGQMIATIGRQHARINGGYEPHLHFGVRQGRNAEIAPRCWSCKLADASWR